MRYIIVRLENIFLRNLWRCSLCVLTRNEKNIIIKVHMYGFSVRNILKNSEETQKF